MRRFFLSCDASDIGITLTGTVVDDYFVEKYESTAELVKINTEEINISDIILKPHWYAPRIISV